MINPRLFHTFLFFCRPGLVKRDFFQPMESLGTPLENGEGLKPSPLVELNPNMLVRDVERMSTGPIYDEGCPDVKKLDL